MSRVRRMRNRPFVTVIGPRWAIRARPLGIRVDEFVVTQWAKTGVVFLLESRRETWEYEKAIVRRKPKQIVLWKNLAMQKLISFIISRPVFPNQQRIRLN